MVRMGRSALVLMFVWGLAVGISGGVAGQDSSELAEAEQLIKRIVELYGAGRYDDAVLLAERVLAIREKDLGPEHRNVGIALNNLAVLYRAKGDPARAVPLAERSLAILQKALGAEPPDVATSLNTLAALYQDNGDYARAEPLHQRALAIREKVFGADHQDVANSLNSLGYLYVAKGDYMRAEPLFQRSLVILEKTLGSEHPDVATSLTNLAWLYESKGDYGRAEPLYQRALAIHERVLGAEHPNVAISLNNLAELYVFKGDYALAEPLHQRALAIREKALGAEHPYVANSLNNLAELYRVKGDYVPAESLHLRALAIRERALGAYHLDVAGSLNNLANLYRVKGEYLRAEPLFQRGLAITEKTLGAEHPDVATSLNNLAELYRATGDYGRAEPLYQRALAIVEKSLGDGHPYFATSLNNLAALYDEKGDYARAEPLLQRALALLEKALGSEHPQVGFLLENLAVHYEAKGDFVRAVQFQQRAEDVREHNLRLVLSTGSEGQKQLYLNTLAGKTSAAVSLHAHSALGNTQAAQLAVTTVLRRKGRALDAMTYQINALRQRAAPEDRQLLDQLATAQSQLAQLRLGGRAENDSSCEERLSQDNELTTDIEKLQAGISRRSVEFRVQTQPLTLEAVQAALPGGSALVELISYRPFDAKANHSDQFASPRYMAYVVKQKGVITFVDLGPVDPINRVADQFLNAISNPASLNAKEAGRALDEMVARPIRKLLGDVRQVLISPDSKLNLVPFAALVDEHGRYLAENYTISYLTSGRDLLRLKVPRQGKQTPLVVANPAFDVAIPSASPEPAPAVAQSRAPMNRSPQSPAETRGRRSGSMLRTNWPKLRGTEEEADYLKKLLPNARVLTGKDATEGALKQVAAPRILHLATHGFFLPDQPPNLQTTLNDKVKVIGENPLLRSGLVLAGANSLQGGAGEDGVLTALEAAGLNLWGTKLVVLSACETGVGDVRSGEGVYGLRRALVLAGTESQVMTLWKVDDTATSEGIIEYYGRLQAGEGRAEALRQVQLEFLRRTTRQHPFFWASFILNGDWRSMQE